MSSVYVSSVAGTSWAFSAAKCLATMSMTISDVR
jgi:hypothetical protein